MILPTKGISAERALATVGAQIIIILDRPQSVSATFDRLIDARRNAGLKEPVTFDWFSLALTVLYTIGLVDYDDRENLVRRGP